MRPGVNVSCVEPRFAPCASAWPIFAAAFTAVRCCRSNPGFLRPARIFSIRNGWPVNSESPNAVRRIWPPPSPNEPSIEIISHQSQMPEYGAARRRAGKDVWLIACFARILLGYALYDRAWVATAENGDRAAASAARDFRSVNSLLQSRFARKLDDSVGGRRPQPAGRITRVRLIHQLASQLHPLDIDLPSKQLREESHAMMLVNRVRRGYAHGVTPFRIDARDRVCHAFVARQKFGPLDPLRQPAGVM